jgi:hypothetical protein
MSLLNIFAQQSFHSCHGAYMMNAEKAAHLSSYMPTFFKGSSRKEKKEGQQNELQCLQGTFLH